MHGNNRTTDDMIWDYCIEEDGDHIYVVDTAT